jgi:hypothetical protein
MKIFNVTSVEQFGKVPTGDPEKVVGAECGELTT